MFLLKLPCCWECSFNFFLLNSQLLGNSFNLFAEYPAVGSALLFFYIPAVGYALLLLLCSTTNGRTDTHPERLLLVDWLCLSVLEHGTGEVDVRRELLRCCLHRGQLIELRGVVLQVEYKLGASRDIGRLHDGEEPRAIGGPQVALRTFVASQVFARILILFVITKVE